MTNCTNCTFTSVIPLLLANYFSCLTTYSVPTNSNSDLHFSPIFTPQHRHWLILFLYSYSQLKIPCVLSAITSVFSLLLTPYGLPFRQYWYSLLINLTLTTILSIIIAPSPKLQALYCDSYTALQYMPVLNIQTSLHPDSTPFSPMAPPACSHRLSPSHL